MRIDMEFYQNIRENLSATTISNGWIGFIDFSNSDHKYLILATKKLSILNEIVDLFYFTKAVDLFSLFVKLEKLKTIN